MAKNPGVEVKRFELVELASKAFKSALTPSNIKVLISWSISWLICCMVNIIFHGS